MEGSMQVEQARTYSRKPGVEMMKMKRVLKMLMVAAVMAAMLMFAGPASAQGGHTSCRGFGQHIAGLANTLGGTFGQTAAAGAPLNDTVETEQALFCETR